MPIVKLLRSSIANKIPTTNQLTEGQLALNYNANNEKLYVKNSAGQIASIKVDVSTTANNTLVQQTSGLYVPPTDLSGYATTASLNAKANNTITITGTGGLAGGGNLTANRTIDLSAASKASLVKADGSLQPGDVVQVTGTSTTSIPSQKLLTDQLALKANGAVTITGTGGLAGGGNLTANRTIDLSAASKASLAKADTAIQAAQLGTAAYLNVTTSNWTASNNQILLRGFGGIGGNLDYRSSGGSVPNPNSEPSVWYGKGTISGFANGGTATVNHGLNIPGITGANVYGVLTTHGQYTDVSGINSISQEFLTMVGNKPVKFIRVALTATTWSDWEELTQLSTITTALNAKANSNIEIICIGGLTGGGNLTASRTIDLNAASKASLVKADTALQPSRIVQTTGSSTTNIPSQKLVSDRLALKADNSVTVTGTGSLTGGGNLIANRTIDLNAAGKASLAKADTAIQAAQLGTAAYLDITVGNADNTSNRVLKVGDLGSGVHTASAIDFNDLPTLYPYSGLLPIMSNTGSTNGPPGQVYFHIYQTFYGSGTGNVTQIAIPYRTNAEDMWMRSRYSGTWQPWDRLITSSLLAQAVGTSLILPMSQKAVTDELAAKAARTITITGTGGLTGGGSLAANRTIDLNAASKASLVKADSSLQPTDVVQTTGTSTTSIPSQKLLTDQLALKANSAISITGTGGLSGGGNLTANRTIDLNAASKASLVKADTALQPANVVQVTGTSTANIPSQKLVTDQLALKANSTVTITGTGGLTGGGTLAANRTVDLNAASKASLVKADTALQPSNVVQVTGTSTANVMSQKAVTDTINNITFGRNQTWVNQTVSRRSGVIYTNSTNQPIMVFTCFGGISASSGNMYSITVDGLTSVYSSPAYDAAVSCIMTAMTVVPPGSTYMVNRGGLTAIDLDASYWLELRT